MDALRDEIMFPNLHSSGLKIDLSWLSNTTSWFHYFKTLQKQYLNKCQYFTVGVYYNLLKYSSSSLRRKSTNFHGSGSQLWCQDFLRLMFTNSGGYLPHSCLVSHLKWKQWHHWEWEFSHIKDHVSGALVSLVFSLYSAHHRGFSGNFICRTLVRQITSTTHTSEDSIPVQGPLYTVCVCVCGWSTKLKIPNLPLNSILFLWNLIQETIRRF